MTAKSSPLLPAGTHGLTGVSVEESLVGPGLSLRLLEAEHVLDVALYAGKVVGVTVNLLRRHEQALRARVLEDVTPVFRPL